MKPGNPGRAEVSAGAGGGAGISAPVSLAYPAPLRVWSFSIPAGIGPISINHGVEQVIQRNAQEE